MLATLRRVLLQEAQALQYLADNLSEPFEQAVRLLSDCCGKVVACGIGKSGHVARKTAGTLSSLGTPSFFLHAAEAYHGDLGMVSPEDTVLLYTHSGETEEIVRLFLPLRAIGAKTVLVTGRTNSSAGRLADVVLGTGVLEEACPNNLAPTTSTTAMLALSDALAIASMERRGFTKEDYARLHPGGTLGKRLLLTVRDVMRAGADCPLVGPDARMQTVLKAITAAGAGGACVADENGALLGYISDGDIRRSFLNSDRPNDSIARDLMTANVETIDPDLLAVDALEAFQMFQRKIGELPVVEKGRIVGLLMLKDLLRSGIV